MHRISVVGSSGAGKTRMASAIALATGAPHLELDSVYHQANWTHPPADEFCAQATVFATQERWVIDGNYRTGGVLDEVWRRADTVVWLDPPKRTVMWQIATRSLWRGITRQELWNGNREHLRNLLKTEPEQNVVRWSWTHFNELRERYEQRMEDPQWVHLRFIRLRSNSEQDTFIHQLPHD